MIAPESSLNTVSIFTNIEVSATTTGTIDFLSFLTE
jgi:hypothetical protein